MKQLSEIFADLFTAIRAAVEENNFFACTNISSELILVSELAGFKDGVFIGEVFESSFSQMRSLFNEYVFGSQELELFTESTKQYIQIIADNYENPDKTQVYEALKNIRNDITVLQIKTFRLYESKPDHSTSNHGEHCCGT
ncbi:MAG: hypothetical protein FWD52_00545 [Candidatus Bathyarchaeota archaeon]|nr:hypothetical protein [Candidatus Termiticorpusculum sp.]